MNNHQIIRSWKDELYHHSLSEAQRAALPPSPVGVAEISDDDLSFVNGGVVDAAPTIILPTTTVINSFDTALCRPSFTLVTAMCVPLTTTVVTTTAVGW